MAKRGRLTIAMSSDWADERRKTFIALNHSAWRRCESCGIIQAGSCGRRKCLPGAAFAPPAGCCLGPAVQNRVMAALNRTVNARDFNTVITSSNSSNVGTSVGQKYPCQKRLVRLSNQSFPGEIAPLCSYPLSGRNSFPDSSVARRTGRHAVPTTKV